MIQFSRCIQMKVSRDSFFCWKKVQDDYRLPQSQRKKCVQVCPNTFDQLCIYAGSCDCGGGNRRSQRESQTVASTSNQLDFLPLLSYCCHRRLKWFPVSGAVCFDASGSGLSWSLWRDCSLERWHVSCFLWASCVGVSVPAVSVSDQLSFLAGVRRLLNNRSLNVCRETNTNKRFGFGRPLTTRCRFVWWGTIMNNQSKVLLISSDTLWMRF